MKMGTYPMFGYVPIFLLAAFAAWGAEPEATVTVLKEGGARLDWLGERIAFDMLGPDDLFAVAAGSRDRARQPPPRSRGRSRPRHAARAFLGRWAAALLGRDAGGRQHP
jgi:hypothetical protein